MFRVPLLVALGLIVAFGVGILSTLYALDATIGFGSIKLGAWEAFPRAQTSDADPYARSHRAKSGKLLYGSAEGLAFSASTDDRGEPLNGVCTYRISGQTPPARLWTLFVARNDGRPLALTSNRPSATNSWKVLRNADSSFTVTVSSAPQAGNWLAVPARGPFKLALTLLDTPTAGSSGLIDLTMPRIERIRCGHA